MSYGRCRGDRGTISLTEMSVAGGISMIVGVMVAMFMASGHAMTAGVVEQSIATRDVTEVLNEYASTLRTSRPVGHCGKDPLPGPGLPTPVSHHTDLATCRSEGYQVEETGPAVVTRVNGEGVDELCGFLRENAVGSEEIPTLVCAAVPPGAATLVINEYRPATGASSTYTTPQWDAVPVRSTLVGRVDGTDELFTLIQSDGTQRAFPGDSADEATVAVRLAPTITYKTGMSERQVDYRLQVALRGGRYARDRFWTGDSELDDGA